jgi:integrase
MPFRLANESTYICWLTVDGVRRKVTTGSTSLSLARKVERVRDRLSAARTGDPALLRAVVAGRVTLMELYLADEAGELDRVRARLDDVELGDYIDAWIQHRTEKGTAVAMTLADYKHDVMTLMPLKRSELTTLRVEQWLAGRTMSRTLRSGKVRTKPVGNSTRRRYYASLTSFVKFLRGRKVLVGANPLEGFEPPRNAEPRTEHLDVPDLERLIALAAPKYRSVIALIQSTGADVRAALGVTMKDVDTVQRMVYIRGTKHHAGKKNYRSRWVPVDDFAWDAFAVALKGKYRGKTRAETPPTPLYGEIVYGGLRAHWLRLVKLAGCPQYLQKDSRHSFAVRKLEDGWDCVEVGRWLGHKDGSQVARVYGNREITPADYERRKQRRAK